MVIEYQIPYFSAVFLLELQHIVSENTVISSMRKKMKVGYSYSLYHKENKRILKIEANGFQTQGFEVSPKRELGQKLLKRVAKVSLIFFLFSLLYFFLSLIFFLLYRSSLLRFGKCFIKENIKKTNETQECMMGQSHWDQLWSIQDLWNLIIIVLIKKKRNLTQSLSIQIPFFLCFFWYED